MVDAAFAAYDADRDGCLTPEEIFAGFSPALLRAVAELPRYRYIMKFEGEFTQLPNIYVRSWNLYAVKRNRDQVYIGYWNSYTKCLGLGV